MGRGKIGSFLLMVPKLNVQNNDKMYFVLGTVQYREFVSLPLGPVGQLDVWRLKSYEVCLSTYPMVSNGC
jgi:hypothetical protein